MIFLSDRTTGDPDAEAGAAGNDVVAEDLARGLDRDAVTSRTVDRILIDLLVRAAQDQFIESRTCAVLVNNVLGNGCVGAIAKDAAESLEMNRVANDLVICPGARREDSALVVVGDQVAFARSIAADDDVRAVARADNDAAPFVLQVLSSSDTTANGVALDRDAAATDHIDAVALIARHDVARTARRAADQVVGRTQLDQDTADQIAQVSCSSYVKPDVIALDRVAGCAGVPDRNAVSGVCRNHVAATRSRATHQVALCTGIDRDAVATVWQLRRTIEGDSDQVAFDRVAVGAGVPNRDARVIVARNDVACRSAGPAYVIVRGTSFDSHAPQRVTKIRRTDDINANVIAEQLVAAAPRILDRHAEVVVTGDDVLAI